MKTTLLFALALAGAFLLAPQQSAEALPQDPIKHCHKEKVCVTIPARCNPNRPHRPAPCPQGSTTAHQSCSWKTVCTDA